MKQGSTTWLWVIILGLIIGAIIVYFLLKFEFKLVDVFIKMFSK